MKTVRTAALAALAMVLGWLAALVAIGSIDATAALLGACCGLALALLLGLAAQAHPHHRFSPADRVTLLRATLTCAMAALVADLWRSPDGTVPVVTLAAVSLALDAVDGPIARRTGTVSEFGARFDLESDAFLILVLSVGAARTAGLWVLAIGLARYVLLLAGQFARWLAQPTPARYWAKVVAAAQGVVLTIVLGAHLPAPVRTGMLLVAAGLLAESFGRQVHWLALTREYHPVPAPTAARRELEDAA